MLVLVCWLRFFCSVVCLFLLLWIVCLCYFRGFPPFVITLILLGCFFSGDDVWVCIVEFVLGGFWISLVVYLPLLVIICFDLCCCFET